MGRTPHPEINEDNHGQDLAPPRTPLRHRLACALVGLAVALCGGELLVRFFDLGPTHILHRHNYRISDNPVLQYELQPGSRDGEAVISTAGLRDREYTTARPEGVLRIVVIGDSVTNGLDLPRGQTYPKQLEALLNANAAGGRVFEVLNLGVAGYNTTQIVEFLRVRGLRFRPDLIIYGYVLNDPQGYSLELGQLRIVEQQDVGSRLMKAVGRGLKHSKLWTFVSLLPEYFKEPTLRAYIRGNTAEYFRRLHRDPGSFGRVRKGLARLARLTSGPPAIPVLVAVFPVAQDHPDGDHALADVHRQVLAEAGAHGFHALDLADAFRGSDSGPGESDFRDVLHPNARGHRLAATGLAEWVVRWAGASF